MTPRVYAKVKDQIVLAVDVPEFREEAKKHGMRPIQYEQYLLKEYEKRRMFTLYTMGLLSGFF